jgi:uncharacterized membrane protein YheB (UPF0754 family)
MLTISDQSMQVLSDFFDEHATQHQPVLDRLQEQITVCSELETKHLQFLIRSKLLKQIDSFIKKKSIQGLIHDLVKQQAGRATMDKIWKKRCQYVKETVDALQKIAKIDASLDDLKRETDLKVRVMTFNASLEVEEKKEPLVQKNVKEDWIRNVKSSATLQPPFMQMLREKTTKSLTNYNTNIYDFLPQHT